MREKLVIMELKKVPNGSVWFQFPTCRPLRAAIWNFMELHFHISTKIASSQQPGFFAQRLSYKRAVMEAMDEKQARQRLLEGGYFVALGVPPGVEFGIDLKSYEVPDEV